MEQYEEFSIPFDLPCLPLEESSKELKTLKIPI